MMKRRHQRNEREIEDNKDMLSNLPDCILLHIMSLLNTKDAVRTCILSTRWKHLWGRLPALTLSSRNFRTLKGFTKFVTRMLSLRDASTALSAFDFEHFGSVERHLLNRIVRYAVSHNVNYLRLSYGINYFPPSLFSCQSLTSLDLVIPPFTCVIFPNSLNLPSLTDLKLHNLSFCSGNDGGLEPFSTFNKLNTLTLRNCMVPKAQTLCISSTTLLNMSIYLGYEYVGYLKVELSAPNLYTFSFTGKPFLKFSGSTLSSIKQVNIDINEIMVFVETPLFLLNLLIEMTGIKSLTVTPRALQALSLVPDILKLKLTCLCNLKLLKVNLKLESYWFSVKTRRDIKLELASGKLWKENVKLLETIKARLEPLYSSIFDGMIEFLLQYSPLAKVDTCLAIRYVQSYFHE